MHTLIVHVQHLLLATGKVTFVSENPHGDLSNLNNILKTKTQSVNTRRNNSGTSLPKLPALPQGREGFVTMKIYQFIENPW